MCAVADYNDVVSPRGKPVMVEITAQDSPQQAPDEPRQWDATRNEYTTPTPRWKKILLASILVAFGLWWCFHGVWALEWVSLESDNLAYVLIVVIAMMGAMEPDWLRNFVPIAIAELVSSRHRRIGLQERRT